MHILFMDDSLLKKPSKEQTEDTLVSI